MKKACNSIINDSRQCDQHFSSGYKNVKFLQIEIDAEIVFYHTALESMRTTI